MFGWHILHTMYTINTLLYLNSFNCKIWVSPIDTFAYCVSCVVGKYRSCHYYNINSINSIMLTATYNLYAWECIELQITVLHALCIKWSINACDVCFTHTYILQHTLLPRGYSSICWLACCPASCLWILQRSSMVTLYYTSSVFNRIYVTYTVR